ncbi:NADP-dependent 3-hydroxy acid dehydrogenase YdfG [Dongia mobilis]|uniref:NADP-dependent 3-hydroxy acid dehydrogenase YdfG n=1 Tax=Dongia mobilis TaxID=578943 RepID=A0A4R6WRS0_9PROT|nr:SDR family NAD(P)-dependent oxidoreductase [Dongia mobilis]TDQ82247.1 NADP-dependent 3-hydroxy acid dehydrogenase YdfG [Dongia mobilis]
MSRYAIIVGAGAGLSAALARACAADGMKLVLVARDIAKLAPLVAELGARAMACDAGEAQAVDRLFSVAERDFGIPELVVFNAGYRARGPIAEIDPQEAELALRNNALAGFLTGQGAARLMLKAGAGSIFFTGATAGVKGFAGSAPFAMGKFALRGLAQSMARELGPKGIHVAHIVIDGGIATPRNAGEGDKLLSAQAIAAAYLTLHKQPRNAWTQELDLRPWSETF